MNKAGAQNSWLTVWLLLLFSGCFAALWYGYLDQAKHWPLKQVQIQGDLKRLNETRLHQQVLDAIQGSFFSVNMAVVRQALLTDPWVADVGIRRIWPDTLRIQIKEQQPVARWLMPEGQVGLVNVQGQVFASGRGDEMSGLPLLSGDLQSSAGMVRFYLSIQRQAAQTGLQIARLDLNTRQEWRLAFANGLQLLLGQAEYQQRWHHFMQTYPTLLGYGKPARIDMRYANGLAVRWLDDATKPMSGQPANAAHSVPFKQDSLRSQPKGTG